MTIFTFEQLTNPPSLEEAEEELLELLQDLGIRTTDWREGSPELTLLKLQAYVYSASLARAGQNAKNNLNQFATGKALEVLAQSHFGNTKQDAVFTVGDMVVTSSVIQSFTFNAGELEVTDGNYSFFNRSQIVVPGNGVITGSFIGEEPGNEYNISADSVLTFANSVPGLAVLNPAITGSNTWITTFGKDAEDDETLRKRNALKWSSLQTGDTTIARVENLALSASSEIKYVSIDDSNPRGPYTVDVWVSKASGSLQSVEVDAVNSLLSTAFFNNLSNQYVSASEAINTTFNRNIVVYYLPSAELTTVKANTISASNAFVASVPIGGKNYQPLGSNIVPINEMVVQLEKVDGVSTVTIDGAANLSFAKNEKLVSPSNWNTLITFTKLSTRP